MFREYLGYFYDVYKAPYWLFIIALGLFMIFNDSPRLMKKSKNDAVMIKIIGWVYIIGSTAVFLIMKVVK